MRALLTVVLVLVASLSACGEEQPTAADSTPTVPASPQPTTQPTTPPTTAPTPVVDGKICPGRLPQSDEPDHGFGTREPATSLPSLDQPTTAWVCRYDPIDAGPGPGGNGVTLAWERGGRARAVAPDRLPVLGELLGQLTPLGRDYACTDDLGPRWLLVLEGSSGTVGVVRDGFGCGFVRLTDDVFATVPGEGTRLGTVPGVLLGPRALARELNRAAR